MPRAWYRIRRGATRGARSCPKIQGRKPTQAGQAVAARGATASLRDDFNSSHVLASLRHRPRAGQRLPLPFPPHYPPLAIRHRPISSFPCHLPMALCRPPFPIGQPPIAALWPPRDPVLLPNASTLTRCYHLANRRFEMTAVPAMVSPWISSRSLANVVHSARQPRQAGPCPRPGHPPDQPRIGFVRAPASRRNLT